MSERPDHEGWFWAIHIDDQTWSVVLVTCLVDAQTLVVTVVDAAFQATVALGAFEAEGWSWGPECTPPDSPPAVRKFVASKEAKGSLHQFDRYMICVFGVKNVAPVNQVENVIKVNDTVQLTWPVNHAAEAQLLRVTCPDKGEMPFTVNVDNRLEQTIHVNVTCQYDADWPEAGPNDVTVQLTNQALTPSDVSNEGLN